MTARECDWLVKRFEAERGHLNAIALRILGSRVDAEDAVQEAWLRFSGSDTSAVEDLSGWLVTIVSRVCLNMLQAKRIRPELPMDDASATQWIDGDERSDPEHEAVLADAIGAALLLVVDRLGPAERVAFVLHDVFGLPFVMIASILGRSPEATRQLASRARRRLQRALVEPDADELRQARMVDAFLAAARNGDLAGLIAALDPEVVYRPDAVAVRLGARPLDGAEAVAAEFLGRGGGARPALLAGTPGAVWAPRGEPLIAFTFRWHRDRITAIEVIGESGRISGLSPVFAVSDRRARGAAGDGAAGWPDQERLDRRSR